MVKRKEYERLCETSAAGRVWVTFLRPTLCHDALTIVMPLRDPRRLCISLLLSPSSKLFLTVYSRPRTGPAHSTLAKVLHLEGHTWK